MRKHAKSGESTDASDAVHVLIVDDDEAFLAAASHALAEGSTRFAVSTLRSGSSALSFITRSLRAGAPPDLVVLDYHLPDTTAPAILQRVATEKGSDRLPILVLTSDAGDDARDSALRAGATAFAVKPSRLRALRDVVVRFWETHGPPRDDSPD